MAEILVVDDHPLMRAGLQCLFDATPDLHVVGTAASGPEGLRLVQELSVDVVLMDLAMPGMSGIETTRQMRLLEPAPTVVVLTSSCSAALVRTAFAAGAAGYLLKEMAPERLVEAVRGLARGERAVDHRVARILARDQRRAGAPEEREPSSAQRTG